VTVEELAEELISGGAPWASPADAEDGLLLDAYDFVFTHYADNGDIDFSLGPDAPLTEGQVARIRREAEAAEARWYGS
jgi:hypothetical protein